MQSWWDVGRLVVNLSIATVLGSIIALHPQRLRRAGSDIDWEMRKSQILLCVAAAIIIIIIEGSLARAFALAGLGSFIRFRTAVRNPLDVALIFGLITIGMSCGLGYTQFAAVCTLFIFVLIYVLNFHEPRYTQVWEVKTQGGAAEQCREGFEKLAAAERMRIDQLNLNLSKRVFVCRFRPPFGVDIPEIDRRFQGLLPTIPEAVQWNRLE
jgi:uncharacterized membrane protein YhiD involved in acid resistance